MSEIVVGIDVGENSVGLATIQVAQNGGTSVENLLVVLHDSGKDGVASGKTGSVSRMASGGVARRVRRLLRNRRKRKNALEKKLAELGYPLPQLDNQPTYAPWEARIQLLGGKITDELSRKKLLSIAIRHMSNHRGWANAWVSLDSYWDYEEPSAEFLKAVESAKEIPGILEVDPSKIQYQADLARYALSSEIQLRPRKNTLGGRPNLLGTQRRSDVVREWRAICRIQEVGKDECEALGKIAFSQEKPKVPVGRVGNDWLPGFENRKRAAKSSLEHQEFMILQSVANLAVRREGSRERDRLSLDDQHLVVDFLSGVVSKDERPTWRDIAEKVLEVPANRLVHSQPEEQLSGLAPVNSSLLQIHSLPAKHPVRSWWVDAEPSKRSEFLLYFADPAEVQLPEGIQAELEQLVLDLDEKELEKFEKLKFAAGRSAHSRGALQLINSEFERSGDPYVTVRNRLFGEITNLGPKAENLDAKSEHPTLQRIMPIIRRYLLGLEKRGLHPSRVSIEHVRDAFLGFNAKQEASLEMIRNRKSREVAKEDIKNSGYGISNTDNVDDGMIRKFQALRRQNSQCLYCGDTPGWTGIEMDHIVSRKSGGNSTRANLVAVCKDCNARKGKMNFAQFAASGIKPSVTLEGALGRADAYLKHELDDKQLRRLKADTKRRLKQTESDEPIDERALASTAYAAVEVRRRIIESLDLPSQNVPVYSGKVVSAARHASGIDGILQLRGSLNVKTRFDRRHHAIDAAVVAMLNPSVARTLAERDDLRRSARDTDEDNGWKTYEGSGPAAIEAFKAWKQQMAVLAEQIQKEIAADRAVVMQPVRYSAHHAALHLDGKAPHVRKRLGEDWSSEERARIVDDRVYEQVSGTAKPSESLPSDDSRTVRLPSGKVLSSDDEIFMFPSLAARQPLPNGSSSELGPTVHHIRLFRWPDGKGSWKVGVVRVWASDLYDLKEGVKGDLLTSPLRESSRAVRRANGTKSGVRDAIAAGVAEHVGTFVIGDEILIDPAEWKGDNAPGRFLSEFPESHWKLLGAMSDSQFTLGPVYLSQEGISEESKTGNRSRLVEVSQSAAKVIGDRLVITASSLWTTPSTLVVRRSSLGEIRGSGSNSPPATWSPHKAVFG